MALLRLRTHAHRLYTAGGMSALRLRQDRLQASGGLKTKWERLLDRSRSHAKILFQPLPRTVWTEPKI